MTDWECFFSVCKREWRVLRSQWGSLLQPLAFYILVACLFPLCFSSGSGVLRVIAPGILCMSLLLAMQLSLLAGFSDDKRHGTLSMWLMSPFPLSWILLAVMLCRWLRFMLPLLIVYPLLASMYHMTPWAIACGELAVFCGSWVVFSIGFILSALLVRLLRQSWLLSCLMLPMCVSPLVLMTSLGSLALHSESVMAPMAWLGILAIIAVSITPGLSSFALRLGMSCDEKMLGFQSAESLLQDELS